MKKAESELKARVAIVTGASRGIGKAISSRLAEAGASVVVADIDLSAASKTAQELGARRLKALACEVDVTDESSVDSLVGATLKNFGRVDILVNNAGIMFRTRFMGISRAEWDQTLRVNLTGPFLCIKAVLPAPEEAKVRPYREHLLFGGPECQHSGRGPLHCLKGRAPGSHPGRGEGSRPLWDHR